SAPRRMFQAAPRRSAPLGAAARPPLAHARRPAPIHSMATRITKLQRWLDVIAFLVARRLPVSVDEIMEAIPAYASRWTEGSDKDRDSVRRTFERDKEELRRAGIPIESVEYHVNFGAQKVE